MLKCEKVKIELDKKKRKEKRVEKSRNAMVWMFYLQSMDESFESIESIACLYLCIALLNWCSFLDSETELQNEWWMLHDDLESRWYAKV